MAVTTARNFEHDLAAQDDRAHGLARRGADAQLEVEQRRHREWLRRDTLDLEIKVRHARRPLTYWPVTSNRRRTARSLPRPVRRRTARASSFGSAPPA